MLFYYYPGSLQIHHQRCLTLTWNVFNMLSTYVLQLLETPSNTFQTLFYHYLWPLLVKPSNTSPTLFNLYLKLLQTHFQHYFAFKYVVNTGLKIALNSFKYILNVVLPLLRKPSNTKPALFNHHPTHNPRSLQCKYKITHSELIVQWIFPPHLDTKKL